MKYLKKALSTFFGSIFLISQTSCFKIIDPLTFKVATRLGADILPFSNWYSDEENLVTFNNPITTFSNEPFLGDAFYDETYSIVAYDVYEGLNKIYKENLDFKLLRVIDTGNLFLMTTKYFSTLPEEEQIFNANSKIVYYTDMSSDDLENPNFQPGLEKIIRKAYDLPNQNNSNSKGGLFRTQDMNSALEYLTSNDGSNSKDNSNIGTGVEFVLLENPFAHSLRNKYKQNDKYQIDYYNKGTFSNSTYSEINSSLKKQLILKNISVGFPNKGLFIRNSFDTKENKSKITNFLYAFDLRSKYLQTSSLQSYDAMVLYGDSEAQFKRFGCDADLVQQLQAKYSLPDGSIYYNMLAYLSPSSDTYSSEYIDLVNFYTKMELLNFSLKSEPNRYYSQYYEFPK